MRYADENGVCTYEPVKGAIMFIGCNPVYEMRFCGWSAHAWTWQVRPTNVCASVKHVRTCEWGWESAMGISQLRTGPLICERDILDVNGTSYLWMGPLKCAWDHSCLDKTRRLSVYKWRPHSNLAVYSHEEVQLTRGGPRTAKTQPVNGISTCDRVFHVWTGHVCVNGSCTFEQTLHAWTKHPRVNVTRHLCMNGFWINVLKGAGDSYTR